MDVTSNAKRLWSPDSSLKFPHAWVRPVFTIHEHVGTKFLKRPLLDALRHSTSALSTYDLAAVFITSIIDSYELLVARPLLLAVTIPFLLLIFLYQLYLIAQWIRYDYQMFLDLGPGGTPTTPWGWVLVTLRKFWANVDVLDPPHVDTTLNPSRGKLFDIPKRHGPRPTIKGVAPQRQLDQKVSAYTTPSNTLTKLIAMLHDKAAQHDNLRVELSYLEGYTNALKAVSSDREHRGPGTDGEWDYEICHPHPFDGSLHMVMHPEDIATTIAQGWGERHPLATKAWYWTFWHHTIKNKRCPVPENLVLIYAPRDEAEFDMVDRFLDASIRFALEK